MVRAVRSGDTTRVDHLVGRSQQRAQLAGVLDQVVQDGSRLVLLGGDAGAGKTSVVDAFVADLLVGPLADRQAQVLRGQCVPLGDDGLPYAPVVGVLRELLARWGRDQVLEWVGAGRRALGTLLPDLADADPPAGSLRLQLFEAITVLWERAADHGPLVVVVEDIHWADESTRHLLRFLGRALTEAPVMIIATYRTDELTRRHPLRPFLAEVGRFAGTVRVDVPSLDEAEVVELLTRLLGRPPSRVVAELVYRRSEGVPYFVEELTRSATRGCVDMPDNLRDALNVRIQRLPEVTQRVLQVAAVAGTRIEHELLETVAELSPAQLDEALREAIDAAVLTADDTGYAFRHALLREVIHDDLLPGQHARLHARFATVLEGRPELVRPGTAPLEIAHHWSAAHEADRAFRWSIVAARSASPAYNESLKLYERALELWDRVESPETVAGARAEVLHEAAVAARDAGESERALALITAALAEPEEPGVGGPAEEERRLDVRADRLMVQARLTAGLMQPGSVEAAREAVRLLPGTASDKARARVLDTYAAMLMLGGERDEAVRVARQAVELAGRSGSSALESSARNTLGASLVGLGAEEEGLAELARAGELGADRTRPLLRYYINASDALHLSGRYREAADTALSGVDVAPALGLERSIGAILAGNAAEPLLALGEWSKAARMVERALQLDPPEDHRAHLRMVWAWLQLWRGHPDDAEAVLADFAPLLGDAPQAPQYTAYALRLDAEFGVVTGDHERAWRATERFLSRLPLFHGASVYPQLVAGAAAARVLDHRGGRSDRTGTVRAALEQARPMSVARLYAPLIRAELDDTAEGWRATLAGLEGERAPAHLLPYAGLRLGAHLVTSHERAEARVVLQAAGDRAAALGAGLLTERIAALAARAGVSSVTAGPSPVGALTRRELEVLRLVAAGRSNGEIGSELFISTKTASVHVSNILAKLEVGGRGEAAAVAHRLGLADVAS